MKGPEQYFVDWEGSTFGYGYGSGEPHTITALKKFFEIMPHHTAGDRSYDYKVLEVELTPAVAWLLISALCKADILEYGSSPRYAWLTGAGEKLQDFIRARSADELIMLICSRTEDDFPCYPGTCNCGPTGYVKGKVCDNPFWERRK